MPLKFNGTGFTWIEPEKKKKKLPSALSSEDAEALKEYYRRVTVKFMREHSDHPVTYIPKRYSATSTNGIENIVCDWFAIHGIESMRRTKVQGRQIEADVVHTDLLGNFQILQKGKYAPSTGMTGQSDLTGTCFNKTGGLISLAIENKNKYTRDRVRPDQVKFRLRHEHDGGTYIIIRGIADAFNFTYDNVKGIERDSY
jgi:hypothetical protein